MLSGTDETSSELGCHPSGCPCGRVHPDRRGLRKPPFRKPEASLAASVYEALCAGRAVNDDRHWHVHYAGNCLAPVAVSANDGQNIFAKRYVRCRRCVNCLNARRYYWGVAAIEQTRLARRTWFGTLTLSVASHDIIVARARFRSDDPNASWWDDPKCDERFARVRDELQLECRRYWARLRKAGHRFKYFLVFERHKSGLPHMHFLLHEESSPILKRVLQEQWPWGFSKPKLVGGRSRDAAHPLKAAWYVVKYLSKSTQSRQIASKGYKPARACRRNHAKHGVLSEDPEGSPTF